MGRTIEEALDARAPKREATAIPTTCWARPRGRRQDAERYFAAYRAAIAAIGGRGRVRGRRSTRPGISVKLSALHPRYEGAKRERVMDELVPRVGRWPVDASTAGSASPSTPRKPTGSTSRST